MTFQRTNQSGILSREKRFGENFFNIKKYEYRKNPELQRIEQKFTDNKRTVKVMSQLLKIGVKI